MELASRLTIYCPIRHGDGCSICFHSGGAIIWVMVIIFTVVFKSRYENSVKATLV